MIAVGLMSGTSLDGIDAALVRIRPRGESYRVDLLNFVSHPFEEALRNKLLAALPPNMPTLAHVAALDNALGQAFADAALEAQGDMPLDFIASHGQTIWHDGDAHITMQIGDPFVLRERAKTTVCYDFRRADCAAGGQGAPLVPYADALLFASSIEDRVALNIGGIANLTWIPRGARPADVTAFDSGPGNMLIDAFVRERTGGAQAYDRNGELALRGAINDNALVTMLSDPFFAQAPPKSTGRERFGSQYLREHASVLDPLSLEDGAATLAALTAASIAAAVANSAAKGTRVLVSGGGVHNAALMRELQTRLAGFNVQWSQALGVHGDAKEAMAFGLLGYELLRGRAANVPPATGAAHPALLGAIAPYELRAVLAKMQAECAA